MRVLRGDALRSVSALAFLRRQRVVCRPELSRTAFMLSIPSILPGGDMNNKTKHIWIFPLTGFAEEFRDRPPAAGYHEVDN